MPRTFTLEEATALLPRLRELLEQASEPRGTLERVVQELESLRWKARGNGHAGDDRRLDELQRARREAVATLQRIVAQVQELGVELKGLDDALVDFPSLRSGRVVYLCWKLDEPEIAWWHPVETGFAGRQPL